MGAHSFTTYVTGSCSLEAAWNQACDDSLATSGGGPYSGTLTTCPGAVLAGDAMGYSDAEAVAEAVLSGNSLPDRVAQRVFKTDTSKRGLALAVPILDPGQAKWRGRKVETTFDDAGPVSKRDLIEKAHACLNLTDRSWIENPEIIENTVNLSSMVKRGQGSLRTEYFIGVNNGGRPITAQLGGGRIGSTKTGPYSSENEALEAARRIFAEEIETGYVRHEDTIVILPVRTKGGECTSVVPGRRQRSVIYTVEVATPTSDTGIGGWLFFGWAAS